MGYVQKLLFRTCELLSTVELSFGLKCFSEGNRKSPFNTVSHSFIHYELSICDSPGPVLCVGHDARMRGGL